MTSRKPPQPPAEGLMDLFGSQDPPAAPVKPLEPVWGALDVTWKKPPAGRHLCQDCVDLIHGRADGPHPHVGTTRRCGPNGERILCHQHAQIHKDADERVERKHAAETAARKAAQKAAMAAAGRRRHREHA